MNKPRVFAADILRILEALPASEHAAACRAAGFGPAPEAEGKLNGTGISPDVPDPAHIVNADVPLPEQAPATGFGLIHWRIAKDRPIQSEPPLRQAPAWLTNEAASFDVRRYVSSPHCRERLPVRPLVDSERLISFVVAHLRPYQAGLAPDLPRAVDRVASGCSVQPLPRLVRRKWPGCVQVVIDVSGVLTPFHDDLFALLAQLRRVLDRRIEVLKTRTGEPGEWVQAAGLAVSLRLDGSPVVVLGDAGCYRPGTGLHRRWATLARKLGAAGVRPLLLAPVPLRLLPDALRDVFDVALLGESGGLSLLGAAARLDHGDLQIPARSQKGLERLRAALFGNSSVSWRLVRQLRLTLQDMPGDDFTVDIGSEAELWQDSGVCALSAGCALMADAVEPALAVLRQLRARHPQVVARLVDHHLAELDHGSSLVHAIFTSEVTRSGLSDDDPAVRVHALAADALLKDLARSLHARPPGDAQQMLSAALGGFIGGLSLRAPGAVGRGDDALQTAWALARAEDIREGRVGLPEGLRLDQLDWLIQPDRVSSGPLHLVAATEATRKGGTGMGLRLELTETSSSSAVPAALIRNLENELPVTIAPVDARGVDARQLLVPGRKVHLPGGQAYRIVTRRREVVIEPFERPAWAKSVGFADGHVMAACRDGRRLRWVHPQTVSLREGSRVPAEIRIKERWAAQEDDVERPPGTFPSLRAYAEGSPAWALPHGAWWDTEDLLDTGLATLGVAIPPWAVRHGSDELGFWADFAVKGQSSTVTQRCRWIAPGTFCMGSPLGEIGRRNDEISHYVTLSRGYWLADTACTQVLWEVVMGENPSHFKDHPANPVERVSWNDVHAFIVRLNSLVPGLDAGLPSEAQWEYACRAGTTTPFYFGANITSDQVNYKDKKGQSRLRTVQVKSLPPNAWGLYEMHGNVFEWCVDWLGDYPLEPQVDVCGPPDGVHRVLRGGSWFRDTRSCRASFRFGIVPHVRSDIAGFRLAPGQKSDLIGQHTAWDKKRGSGKGGRQR
ncbi:MAG: formylglycine-generating enzyme family protein [Zoogloea sp.]|nr:formylglycine-generating enzyme family protein [Zoogloea sp.]